MLLSQIVCYFWHFQMFHVLTINQFLSSQIKCFLSDSFQLRIAFDNVSESGLEALADFDRIFSFGPAEVMDKLDDFFENFRSVGLDVCHELFNLLIFRFADDKFIALFHVDVKLFGEFWVGKQCVANLDVAVILIFSFLIFPQKFGDILIGLQILVLELLQPFFGLLHIELF